MAWQGYFIESKRYVGYETRQQKINFWYRFPRAYIRLCWLLLKDYIIYKIRRKM